MREIQILKDRAILAKTGGGTIASFSEVNDLDAGAIGIFTTDGAIIDTTDASTIEAAVKGQDGLYVAVGGVDGAKLSQIIPVESARVSGFLTTFVPAVAQVVQVDDVSASSDSIPVINSDLRYECGVKIYNIGNGTFPPDAPAYVNVPVTTADTDVEKLIDKIIAAHDGRFATLTKSGTGDAAILVCTAPTGTTISVVPTGIWSDNSSISVAQTVAATFSQGAGADVAAIERDFSTEQGNTNQVYQSSEWWKYAFVANLSANYDMATVSWEKIHSNPINVNASAHQDTVFAIPTASAGTGGVKLKLVLDTLYGIA